MKIPYRIRKKLSRAAWIGLIVLLAGALFYGCWTLWLQRFVIYTRQNGAVFDFQADVLLPAGERAKAPAQEPVRVIYNDGESAAASQELRKVVGYYIDEKALAADMDGVRAQIQALEKGTPVMIDVKNIYGRFFYSSAVGSERSGSIDPQAMDDLLKFLDKSGMYTIARFPALRDYTYGLNHVPDGVHHSSGGYLYQDGAGCYWLNPDTSGTMSFLMSIIQELKSLGFDEVVLTEFHFPDTQSMLYNGDKPQALAKAAQSLVANCATGSFAVSFVGDGSWTAPTGRTRMYVEDVEASGISQAVERLGVEDLETGLVFVTTLYDTRFDDYGVLRPLDSFH